MRGTFVQIILSVLCLTAQAQKVSNIRAEQQGQEIIVFYFLDTQAPCQVDLVISIDNGMEWSTPLKNVYGDVGKGITEGVKTIHWKVLSEREELISDGVKFKIIVNSKKPFEQELVFVKGGRFNMGSLSGDVDEGPRHEVNVESFYIGKFEVTQQEWKEVTGKFPNYFNGCKQCPVEQVSWVEVQVFIEKLNEITGKFYRLPTEAEWEYAAIGGSLNVGKNYRYCGGDELDSIGWYSENSMRKTHLVGEKKSNELGIYDMTGNVWEWCSDWYGPYSNSLETNPRGPVSGEFRVIRGGSWADSAQPCRAQNRNKCLEISKYNYLGFRLALSSN
jgi:formylglycine-generating enzyme required for sulfatase activity